MGKNWGVGDHCYWIDVKTAMTVELSETAKRRLKSLPLGDRINISGITTTPLLAAHSLTSSGEWSEFWAALFRRPSSMRGLDKYLSISEAAYYSTEWHFGCREPTPSVTIWLAPTRPQIMGKRRDDAGGHGHTLCSFRHVDPRRQRRLKREHLCRERELKVAFRKATCRQTPSFISLLPRT